MKIYRKNSRKVRLYESFLWFKGFAVHAVAEKTKLSLRINAPLEIQQWNVGEASPNKSSSLLPLM